MNKIQFLANYCIIKAQTKIVIFFSLQLNFLQSDGSAHYHYHARCWERGGRAKCCHLPTPHLGYLSIKAFGSRKKEKLHLLRMASACGLKVISFIPLIADSVNRR